jgi:hypothetical protein
MGASWYALAVVGAILLVVLFAVRWLRSRST